MKVKMVRQYILRKDGEYDVLETSIDDLDFSQLKEYVVEVVSCIRSLSVAFDTGLVLLLSLKDLL